LIKEEQLLYETFLSTIKDFAKDKLNKTVSVIKDWKDAAVVFAKILSNGELLNDFLDPLRRRVKDLIDKINTILETLKLDFLVKRINNFFKRITNLEGWKSLFSLLSLGGILFYVKNKLPEDGVKAFVNQYLSKNLKSDFLDKVISKLTNWKTFTGWLSPIIGGIGILYEFIKDLLSKFSQALKSGGYFDTKIIKEKKQKKQKTNIMDKKIIKEWIKNEIIETLKENEEDKEVSSGNKLGGEFIKTGQGLKKGSQGITPIEAQVVDAFTKKLLQKVQAGNIPMSIFDRMNDILDKA